MASEEEREAFEEWCVSCRRLPRDMGAGAWNGWQARGEWERARTDRIEITPEDFHEILDVVELREPYVSLGCLTRLRSRLSEIEKGRSNVD